MLENFKYFMPTQIVFHEDAIASVKEYVSALKFQKPMIVTDAFLANTSFGKTLIASLPEAILFCDVEVNPSIESIDACALLCRQQGCDGIIALGGGSCIDSAKGCSVMAKETGSVRAFLDSTSNKREIPSSCLPIIAIPTTSGTGSEVSQYAVLSDRNTLRKDSLSSFYLYPKVAILDPKLTLELPRNATIYTGLDVFSHALESLLSKIKNPLTDVLALEAIRLVLTYLPNCVANPTSIEARKQMVFASTLAGIAMSHCCGTLPHGMGCPLSGHYQVPHGLAVGVLQKYALLYMGKEGDEICHRIMKYLDQHYDKSQTKAKADLILCIDTLFEQLDCPSDLSDFHLENEGISRMVEDASVHGCTSLNPYEVSKAQIKEIYEYLKGSTL